MSILLDAVTRKKQQEGVNVPDPVMTPRPNYQPRTESSIGLTQLKWPIVFTLALGAGVSLAWFASQFNKAPVIVTQSHSSQDHESFRQDASQVKATVKQAGLSSAPKEQSSSSIRIAGKVALPVAKPYVANVNQANIEMRTATANVLATQKVNDESATSVLKGQDSQIQTGFQRVEAVQGEPIILGANANQRGMDELAKLKREVEYAASDVGMEAQPKSANNLVAAFEAALRDVEASESQNTEVTPDELNPIPQVATSDGVRKFGELPLSVQQQVPEFNINAHVYAGAPERRWLNVDGVELQQGDSISAGLKIIEIRPRDVILEIQGESFKVPAI